MNLAVSGPRPLDAASSPCLATRGFAAPDIAETIDELFRLRALRDEKGFQNIVQEPPADFPLQTLVMNLTNQCNLSCHYCYEFGEDKIATPEGKKKFMDVETAKASVDYLFAESEGRTGGNWGKSVPCPARFNPRLGGMLAL